MRTDIKSIVFVLVVIARLSVAAEHPANGATAATHVYEQAFNDPASTAKFSAFRRILPKVGAYYVVEGDVLMAEQELHVYVDSRQPARTQKDKSAELLLNLYNGGPDYYRDPVARILTYSVERSSFPTEQEYETVRTNFAHAASDWVELCEICGIQFQYKSELDSSASSETTNFVVRYFDAGGAYIAASFFPHDAPPRRYVNVAPSYYAGNGFDPVGVFRHEIGHILGYRHEHIQGIPGCAREDDQWKPLTPYDPHSVMHYFCGGGGSLQLAITDIDAKGHRTLYGLTQNTSSSSSTDPSTAFSTNMAVGKSTLIVRIEGGDVSDEAGHVLALLHRRNLLPLKTYALQSGQHPGQVYVDQLGLPGSGPAIFEVIEMLNPGKEFRKLRPRDTISVPDVHFYTYEFSANLDSTNTKDKRKIDAVKSRWDYLLEDPKKICPQLGNQRTCNVTQPTNFRLTGYEMRIDLSTTMAKDTAKAINGLKHGNLFALYQSSTKPSLPMFSSHESISSSDFIAKYRSLQVLDVNEETDVGQHIDMPPSGTYQCAGDFATLPHPDIILVDTPVLHHPDLADKGVTVGAMGPAVSTPLDETNSHYRTVHILYDRDRDHGTHLAGIMVARKNGFGIIGVDPEGHIISTPWPSPPSEFVDTVQEMSEQSTFPIFTFASVWPSDGGGDRIIFKRLAETKNLWIVAAGQPETPAEKGINLDSSTSTMAPMRFGKNSNIIVVTACQNCYAAGQATLFPWANYSTSGLVHVAAPGDPVPSTIAQGSYETAFGTSQATALVAGLASAMVACWPDYYSPERLKYRIQLTSRPSLTPDDAIRIAAGVVDGRAAMKDPRRTWMLTDDAASDAAPLSNNYKEIDPQNWCTDSITLTTTEGDKTSTVDVVTIRRLVQVGNQWVIYYRPSAAGGISTQADIAKIGPGFMPDNKANMPLLKTADNKRFAIGQITDLILSKPVNAGACAAQ